MSSLSWRDQICLIAQYNSQFNKEKFVSDNDLLARGYNETAIEKLNEAKKKNKAKFLESCGLRFKSDISNLKHPSFFFIFELYQSYKNGIMPFSGGSAEQPSQVMDMMQLFSLLEIERENNANKGSKK